MPKTPEPAVSCYLGGVANQGGCLTATKTYKKGEDCVAIFMFPLNLAVSIGGSFEPFVLWITLTGQHLRGRENEILAEAKQRIYDAMQAAKYTVYPHPSPRPPSG